MALVLKNAKLSQAEALSRSKPYFLSRAHITEINEVFLNAVNMEILSASPAAFAWGSILYQMREIAQIAKENREMEQFQSAVDSFQSNLPTASASRSLEQTFYEDLLDIARVPAYGDDFVGVLTMGAIERGQLFEVVNNIASAAGPASAVDDLVTNLWIRNCLMSIVRVSSQLIDYSPEIVAATLSILKLSTNPLQGYNDSITQPSDPRFVFLHDEELMGRIFHIARSRFPYESVPFIQLCRALTGKDEINESGPDAILNELDAMETFTQMVSPDFQGYETIREDENANFVSLVQPIPMIASTTAKLNENTGGETALVVTGSSQLQPATTGQVVSESKPAVIMWYHKYSCITFLGSWLEKWATSGGRVPNADDEAISEIIGLLTDLMAARQTTEGGNGSRKILEIASEGLNERSDIVSVIFDILERNLQGVSDSLDVVVACLRFVRALVSFLPSRAWPFLSRSSLLGPGGQGSRFSAIVQASEVTSGNYPFLLSCVDLFNAVVEDAISNAAARKMTARTIVRSGDSIDRSAGVPSHVVSKVLSNFVRVMVEIYNSSGNWRFNQPEHRFQVNGVLAENFERIIYYTHGIDETENAQSKISAIFEESAEYILDVLRPQSKDELPLNPVLRIILDGLQTPTTTVYLRQLLGYERQLITTLKLAIRLIQAAQLAGSARSLLEDQLFKASPILVKLYSAHDRFRLPVVTLLELLITNAALDVENEPASFLGHLGSESTCLFLDVLAQFDKPLPDMTLLVSVWRLLSAFVSKRQQWVAIYLLTGSSPRDTLKLSTSGEKAPRMRNIPFLKTALDSLANIDHLDPLVSLSLLEFISSSQEHWPWATPQLGNHSNFFSSIVSYVSHLKLDNEPVTSQISLIQIAAITANLCAVYLHSAKEARDQTFVKMLVPLVSWYAENAVDVSGYNASLHANLKRNFEMKYAGCKLQRLKRTGLEVRPLGKGYYYDLYLSDKLLSYDFSWRGRKGQGFADEFERANLNLSLVEAQVVSDVSCPDKYQHVNMRCAEPIQ
jgi:nuclear pore complex protein Nup188